MKTVRVTLQLSDSISSRTRVRCPHLVFEIAGSTAAVIRSDVESPVLPFEDGTVDTYVVHDDAFSRVIDEEAWLQEFSRTMTPGARLELTLPADGPLAWLDAMNLYRYVTDITKRGDAPDAALPTGWNRHYTRDQLRIMTNGAGFDVAQISYANHAVRELGMLLSLVTNNWLRGNRRAEAAAFPRFAKRSPDTAGRLPFGTTWAVSLRKRA